MTASQLQHLWMDHTPLYSFEIAGIQLYSKAELFFEYPCTRSVAAERTEPG